MNRSAFALACLLCSIVYVESSRLPCLPKRKLKARRNPRHHQIRRCCGEIPYSSDTRVCCHNNDIAGICHDWSNWNLWSQCSVACGGGERRRTRVCTSGQGCPLDGEQKQACNVKPCIRDYTCHRCLPSDSNDECNGDNETCQVLNGEGCQNIVRSENFKVFVEKRCKQLQACHTESRTLILQGTCDPLKDVSLCSFCCEGDGCNEAMTWPEPSWYRESWKQWLTRLTAYAQTIQNGRRLPPQMDNFETFSAASSSVLLANLPQSYQAVLKAAKASNGPITIVSNIDSIIIHTILTVAHSDAEEPVRKLLTELRRTVPKAFAFSDLFRKLNK